VIVLHVLEPFASGVATAVCSITGELRDLTHIIIHGSRSLEGSEKVKLRFPKEVTFIEWKNVGREINLVKDFRALKELKKHLKPYARQKDIAVHLHSSKAGFLGRIACSFLGIKNVIYTPHCGAFLRKDVSSTKRKLFYFFEWIGSRFGGRVVGCGPSEGELYKKLGKNTTYVSNGVTINKESGAAIANSRNLISFSGVVSFQKDPSLWNIVARSSASAAKVAGYSFCWIGDGPLANKLDKDLVTLTGWKNSEEVNELLEKTAIYFSTSAWEGLPYGVLEAMSHGCALLLRNVPGNRELVIPGENGWLFDTKEEVENRLKEMIKDKPLLIKMGKRSREIIEQNYTIKQMGEGYRKIYMEGAA